MIEWSAFILKNGQITLLSRRNFILLEADKNRVVYDAFQKLVINHTNIL